MNKPFAHNHLHGHRFGHHSHDFGHKPHSSGHCRHTGGQLDTFQHSADTSLSDETMLCRCRKIRIATVKAAIANGANSCDDVIHQTGLGTACGHCTNNAKAVIQKLLTEK